MMLSNNVYGTYMIVVLLITFITFVLKSHLVMDRMNISIFIIKHTGSIDKSIFFGRLTNDGTYH